MTNNRKPSDEMFTPVDRRTGTRLNLRIHKRDIPRGHRWQRTVHELDTGKTYRAWGKSCGVPGCYCDAYVEELSPEPEAEPTWCRCVAGFDDPFFVPDGWCKCGVSKHHWHCGQCKQVCQVG